MFIQIALIYFKSVKTSSYKPKGIDCRQNIIFADNYEKKKKERKKLLGNTDKTNYSILLVASNGNKRTGKL